MDDESLQLEAELKRLRPRRLAPDLETRVVADLARRRRVTAVWWVALPLAAALAVAIAPWRPAPASAPASATVSPAPADETKPDEYKPVAAENVLYAAQDEGLITLADGGQARRVRRSYVDTITWRNPSTNASLTWSVPRDEVRVIPVNLQ